MAGARTATLVIPAALTALAACLAAPNGARAQSFANSITTITPPPARQAVPQRRGGAPVARADDDTDGAGAAPPPLPAGREPDDAGGEPGLPGEGLPGEEPDGGLSRLPVDGDLAPPVLAQPVDGRIDLSGSVAPVDGDDPTRNDARRPEDRAAFESPPAGFDPLLFQAEIEPILDRRPAQLFRFEPYEPVGVRLGSFTVLGELEQGILYNSNVLQSSNARSDVAYEVRPALRVVSNWRRHAMEFRANGTLTGFSEFETENTKAYTLELRSRLDITSRLNVEGLVSRDLAQESRSSIDATSIGGTRADIVTNRSAFAVNQRFNRLSLQLRGAVSEFTVDDARDATGTLVSNRDRSGVRYDEAVRASWEFKPTLFAFAEYALNQRTFDARPADGISRDSTGDRIRLGLGFGNTGQKLRGEISVGWGRQKPRDSRLSDIEGVIIDANLAWRASALTSVLLTARTDVTDTTQAASPGALSREAGIEARHALRRNLIANAGLTYAVLDYEGIALTERTLTAYAGIEYFVNREISLFGRYRHINLDSTDAARGYDGDEVRLGLRVRR
ncbi:MAG: outer membrane beta-barrel protein [Gammaproteobacteria bacterium]